MTPYYPPGTLHFKIKLNGTDPSNHRYLNFLMSPKMAADRNARDVYLPALIQRTFYENETTQAANDAGSATTLMDAKALQTYRCKDNGADGGRGTWKVGSGGTIADQEGNVIALRVAHFNAPLIAAAPTMLALLKHILAVENDPYMRDRINALIAQVEV